MLKNALLSVSQMAAADAAAIAAGIPGLDLMEAAGQGIYREIVRRWPPRPVTVLCGPGNNGGDGFVVARLLQQAGWPVGLFLLGDPGRLKGDAARNAERWTGEIRPLAEAALKEGELIIDALFGAGLTRPLEGQARACVDAVNRLGLDCVGVDMPSGVDGDSGDVLGAAPKCLLTVTFFRRKPGHLLLPGRDLAGEVVVVDIGIPETVLEGIGPTTFANGPGLWLDRYPWPSTKDHKYSHGHALIAGGATMTGAARLAATAARRIGAGLVTIAAPDCAFDIYAAAEPGNIVQRADDAAAFASLLEDPRRNAVLVGPGCGVDGRTRDLVLAALGLRRPTVLDADALSVFAPDPATLFTAIGGAGPVVMTPHEGEFSRLFNVQGNKIHKSLEAASLSGAVVVLKGSDTVIAAPDGRLVINEGAPPTLATAGSGDVLAGFITGLLAQGMEALDGASAACWLHGRAAAAFGPALIAEDLSESLPGVLQSLRRQA